MKNFTVFIFAFIYIFSVISIKASSQSPHSLSHIAQGPTQEHFLTVINYNVNYMYHTIDNIALPDYFVDYVGNDLYHRVLAHFFITDDWPEDGEDIIIMMFFGPGMSENYALIGPYELALPGTYIMYVPNADILIGEEYFLDDDTDDYKLAA